MGFCSRSFSCRVVFHRRPSCPVKCAAYLTGVSGDEKKYPPPRSLRLERSPVITGQAGRWWLTHAPRLIPFATVSQVIYCRPNTIYALFRKNLKMRLLNPYWTNWSITIFKHKEIPKKRLNGHNERCEGEQGITKMPRKQWISPNPKPAPPFTPP